VLSKKKHNEFGENFEEKWRERDQTLSSYSHACKAKGKNCFDNYHFFYLFVSALLSSVGMMLAKSQP
jgi:hypothetical protein